MNKKIATIACLLAMGISTSFAQGVVIDTDATTGAISKIAIDNDANNMNWVLSPDGKQYAWVTSKYGWGLGFITVNGNKLTWEKPVSTAKNLTYPKIRNYHPIHD